MIYIQGDLISLFKEGYFNCIAHQTNCQKLIRSGVAGALAKEFPSIRYTDEEHYKKFQDNEDMYGTLAITETPFGDIINLYSQFQGGRCLPTGIDSFHMRCVMLEQGLDKINSQYKGLRIGIPLLASGIAAYPGFQEEYGFHLNYFKKFIAPIVSECLFEMDVTIVYL